MRVNKTASAAIVVALSGSLALGASGAAFATVAAPGPDRAAAASAPGAEAEATTAEQFRVVEHLGELARITGVIGRLAQDERATPQQLQQAQQELKERDKQLLRAVERSAQKIRPAAAPENRDVPRLADAVEQFEATVDGVVNTNRSDNDRETAAAELVARLAAVTQAAATEAGIPQDVMQSQLPQDQQEPQTPQDQQLPQDQQEPQTPQDQQLPQDQQAPQSPQDQQQPQAPDQQQGPQLGGTSDRAAVQPNQAPDKGTLKEQAQVLRDAGGILDPITNLLDAVLGAKDSKLSPKEVNKHSQAIDKAVKAAKAADKSGRADLRDSAVNELHDEAKDLLKAAEAGNDKKVGNEAQDTVQASVNYLASTLTNKQLPKADISDLTPGKSA